MRNRRLIIGLGTIGAVGIALAIVIGVAVWPRPASSATGPVVVAKSREQEAELLKLWSRGDFAKLSGSDIHARLDRHLMLDLRTELPAHAEDALRAKLAAMLEAYSSTDFAAYLRYRPPVTLCAKDHPQLVAFVDMARSQASAAGYADALPSEPVEVLRTAWNQHVSGANGVFAPGAQLEAVNWATARATVCRLTRREFVPEEWVENAAADCHQYKEFIRSGRPTINPVLFQKLVPNATSPEHIVTRDGALLYVDFEIVARRAPDPAHPMIARFAWDEAAHTWLPLSLLQQWIGPDKPFFW